MLTAVAFTTLTMKLLDIISPTEIFILLKMQLLKGDVSHKFAVISKPKNVCLSAETKLSPQCNKTVD